jgi:hypothetical protein
MTAASRRISRSKTPAEFSSGTGSLKKEELAIRIAQKYSGALVPILAIACNPSFHGRVDHDAALVSLFAGATVVERLAKKISGLLLADLILWLRHSEFSDSS